MKLLVLTVLTLAPGFGQGGFQGPGRYQIRNVETQKMLDLGGDRLIQSAFTSSATQTWDIEPAALDVYYIRNVGERCALEPAQDRKGAPVFCTTKNNPSQRWRLERVEYGSVLVISRFRKPIVVPEGSRRDGFPLEINERTGGGSQRFLFTRIGIGPSGFGQDRKQNRATDDRFNPPGGFDSRGRYYDERERMWKLRGDGVCLYRSADFHGEALCLRSGEDIPDVQREGGGRFLSVKFFGSARQIEIYERGAFRGEVVRMSHDEVNLRKVRSARGAVVADFVGSLRAN